MWYVIQVRTGQEIETAEKCRARIIKPGEDVFVMQGERMFKTGRGMEKRLYVLFRSYVFAETQDIDDFWMRLRSMKVMTKVLTTGETMTPIHPEEESFLRNLGGDDHIVRFSEGYMAGEKLVVTEGAMKGCEGRVKWIDRHRRYAVISVELLGQMVDVKLGLEVLKKI